MGGQVSGVRDWRSVKTDDRWQTTEKGKQREEIRGQRSDIGGQKGQTIEGGRQMTDFGFWIGMWNSTEQRAWGFSKRRAAGRVVIRY